MQRSHPNGQFVTAEWLGVGKKYISEELPEFVTDAMLEIPGSFQAAYIPKMI